MSLAQAAIAQQVSSTHTTQLSTPENHLKCYLFHFSLLIFIRKKKLLISDVTKCKIMVEWFIHIKGPFAPGFNVNVCIFVGITFLPPANEVWGKVIFVILFTGGGGLVPGGGGVWSRGDVPGPGGCMLLGGRVPGPGVVPGRDPPNGYCCGRYASYWNAFLCIKSIVTKAPTGHL